MEELYDVFIDFISFYINGRFTNEYDFDKIDWATLYELADIHCLTGVISAVINKAKLNIPAEYAELYEQAFLSTCMYSFVLEEETRKLLRHLNDDHIPHILSKGYVVRDMYPDKELRTMGDVDILVRGDETFKTAAALLEKSGYEITDTYFDEVSFDKNNIHFELHSSLMTETLGNGFDYKGYFDTLCADPVQISGYTFKLKDEDHFIYLLAHIGKHFYNEGCGIRMILDIALYLKAKSKTMDRDYIRKELEKIKLLKFSENILYLCGRWFGTDAGDTEMSDDLYLKLKNYILEAGTFGFYERNPGIKIARMDYGNEKKASVLKWFFPGDKSMRQLSDWYKDKPKILLPAAWVKRWIDSLRTKGPIVIKKAFGAVASKDEAKKQTAILRELGLYQEID